MNNLLNPLNSVPYDVTHSSFKQCCKKPPKAARVNRFPTPGEHKQFTEWACCTFMNLMWKLAITRRYGGRLKCDSVWASAKRAYLWLTALGDYDPDLFEGNRMKLSDYWEVVERVREMYSGTGNLSIWQSGQTPPAP